MDRTTTVVDLRSALHDLAGDVDEGLDLTAARARAQDVRRRRRLVTVAPLAVLIALLIAIAGVQLAARRPQVLLESGPSPTATARVDEASTPPPVSSTVEVDTGAGVLAAELRLNEQTIARAELRSPVDPAVGREWTATLSNRGTVALCYGARWERDRWDGEGWQALEGVPVGGALYVLEPGGERTESVITTVISDLEAFIDAGGRNDGEAMVSMMSTLEPGWYRLGKPITDCGPLDADTEATVEVIGEVTP